MAKHVSGWMLALAALLGTCVPVCAGPVDDAAWRKMKDEAVNRRRLVIWDDDGCDMTHYPYQRPDLAKEPASVRNFEQVFLEATEDTRADVIGYSGTMGFGFFTQLRTGGFVNTNRFAAANEPWRNAVNEFKALGVDSLDMATAFARRNGKEIFLSLRFNDNHDAGSTPEHPNCLYSPFKMLNPETQVGYKCKVRCCGNTAADFAQEKVRAFARRYVRAYLENYDLDGIEFDFFRHPQLFRTVALGGHATDQELGLMTELMREFRAMAEEVGRRRGRPFVLGARVPDSFDYCRAIGIDLDAWLRAGALDFVVVGGYFQFRPWRDSADHIHRYGVRCYASLDESRIAAQVKRTGGRLLPGRDDRTCWIARIAAARAQGMDGVGLFNLEYFPHEDQRWIMRHDIRDLDGVDKLYFATYVGGGGYQPENFLVGGRGFFELAGLDPSFPPRLASGGTRTFDFAFGDDLDAAARKGLEADIEVELLATADGGRAPRLEVNDRPLAPLETVDGRSTFIAARDTFRKGANHVRVETVASTTLHDFSVRVTYRKAGTPSRWTRGFARVPAGPVEKAVTSLGTWTAARGHAELWVDGATRARGLRLMGGEKRAMQLDLAAPRPLADVRLWCERFTGRAPYAIAVEARTADGTWHPVYAEDGSKPTKERRPLAFAQVPGPVDALRFSGTSAGGAIFFADPADIPGRKNVKDDAPPEGGMTDIGALTRVFLYLAAGVAVDRGDMRDDAVLAALLDRMFREGPDGAAAADELSAKIGRETRQNTALFLSERILNRAGRDILPFWTCEAQEGDRSLMKGATGLRISDRDLAVVLALIPARGMGATRRVVSEAWFTKHPLRGMKIGEDHFEIDAGGKVRFTHARHARKPSTKAPPSLGERNRLVDFPPHGAVARNSEGDILKLKDGRLMVMWSRMTGSNGDDASSQICRRLSDDGGKTWTDDEVVFETPRGSLNLMCVSLLRLRDGRIALAYLHKRSHADCRPVFRHSTDEGRTWSEPVQMIPDSRTAYYVSNNGRLQQLASGRLVLSTCRDGLLAVYSDDGGKSWKMSGRVTARTRIGGDLRMEEPGTFAKTDGTLVMYCRTNDDYQYWTESKDEGATWGPLVPSPLRSPRSPAAINRLSDGRLCCVWNDHENHPDYRFLFPYHNGGRQPLTVGFSSDDGRTWTDRVDIETEGWLCYPAFKEIDGRLFILYCFGDGMKSMRLTALPL